MREVIEILRSKIQEAKNAVEELEEIVLYLETEYEKELRNINNTLTKIHRAIETVTGERAGFSEHETKNTQMH